MADDLTDLETAREQVRLKRAMRPLQTPGDVLQFWFGDAPWDQAATASKYDMWFKKSDATDALIAHRSVDLLARLASGDANSWAARGPAERLAAIVALDQFPRNIFRDHPGSFENDALALQLCKDGLDKGDDKALAPIKRWFFYMPLEHSEDLEDQERCVALFKEMAGEVDDAQKAMFENALDYARKHRDVIETHGRFPHRNEILGRSSTEAEKDYLAQPGAGF